MIRQKRISPPAARARSNRRAATITVLSLLLGVSFPDLAEASAKSSRDFLISGLDSYEKGDFKTALIQLKNAVKDDPDNAAARFELGQIELRIGDYPAASKEFTVAQARGYPAAKTVPALARALLMQNEFDKVLKTVQPCPDDPICRSEVLALQGHAHLAQNDIPAAAAAVRGAIEAQPSSLIAQTTQAMVLMAQGDLAAAETLIDDILTRAPKSVEASSLKGELRRQAGDYAGAARAFRAALAITPGNLPVRTQLVMALMADNRTDEITDEIDQILRQDPHASSALYIKAVHLARAGKMDQALSTLRPIESEVARDPRGAFLLALVQAGNNNLESALSYALVFHTRSPGNLAGTKLLATIYARLGSYDRVIVLLAPLHEKLSQDVEALDLLGSAYLAEGRIKEANDVLAEAVQLRPDADATRGRFALARLRGTDTRDEGIHELEDLVGRNPDQAQYGAILVGAYVSVGKYDRAIALASTAITRAPTRPQPLTLRAAAHLGKGNETEALTDLDSALALDPGFVPAALMLSDYHLRRGEFSESRALIDRLLLRTPTDLRALLARAKIEIRDDRSTAALPYLERAIAAAPEEMEPRALWFQALTTTHQTAALIQATTDLTRLLPRNPAALELAAQALRLAGQTELSAEPLERLRHALPVTVDAQMRLGQVLDQFGKLPEARTAFLRAAETDPHFLPAWAAAAATERRLNGTEAALKIALDAQKRNPASFQAKLISGDILRASGRLDEAAELYARLMGQSDSAEVLLRLFSIRIDQGQRKVAYRLIEDWLTFHPDDVNTRLALGDDMIVAKEFAGAATQYEKVIVKQPRNAAALNNLAYVYDRLHDRRAIETARRAYTLTPNAPMVADTYGDLLYRSGERRLGAEILRQSHLAAPGEPQIAYHMAVILADRGDANGAKALLKPLVEAKPPPPLEDPDSASALYKRLGGL